MTPLNYNSANSKQNVFGTPASSGFGSLGGSIFNTFSNIAGSGNSQFHLGSLATGNTIGSPWATLPTPTMTGAPLQLGANGALPAGLTPMSTPTVKQTPTGGLSFPSSTFQPQTSSVSPATSGTDVSYNSYTPYTTPNGGTISLDKNGQVADFTPAAGYSITTSGALPSTALGSNLTTNDLMQQRNKYADAVQALAQANQYSPDYLNAYQTSQNLQSHIAQLQGNLAAGGAPGDTQGFAQGFTDRAVQGASAEKAQADISLAVQTLIRNGNIAGAKALVDAYAPQSVGPGSSLVSPVNGDVTYGGAGAYSDYQAQQTYFNLAQNFPDANIPAYNPQLSAQQNLQVAQQAAASSPSFQSRNLVPVSLPGGGYSFVNKNQIVTGANGQAQIISPAQGAQADAYKTSISTLQNQQSQIQSQISTVDNNFPLLLNIVQKYGLNENLPLMNQFQQLGDRQLGQTGVTQLNAVAQGLKATIAQIISRGGSVDNQTRNEANALLPTNANWKVLNDLYQVVKAEGAGVINGISSEKQKNIDALNSLYSSPSSYSSSGSSGGYIDASQATW